MGIIRSVFSKTKRYLSEDQRELRRLSHLPRYQQCETSLLGKIKLADPLSFIAGYEEIFIKENYHFRAHTKSPFILDCGSNIGLSIIYFKKLYPKAQIIAFEPDANIFKILQDNVRKLGFNDIQLNNAAVAGKEGTLSFYSEGGFSGRLVRETEKVSMNVSAVNLSKYIDRKVDLLKLDIEGAEGEVLTEIENKLELVERLFIEYHSIIGSEQNLDQLLSLLKKNAYRVHIKEAYTAKHPFVEIPAVEGMDNQLEIYAWRK